MDCRISLTANAGVIVQADICFMVDALHNTKSKIFSSLSPEMVQEVFRQTDAQPPQAILVSHEHSDHYSAALCAEARRRYPAAAFIFPAAGGADSGSYEGQGLQVSWQSLPHAQALGYEDVANYAFLMEFGGRRVFTAGDAAPLAPQTIEYVDGLCPDLAILNFSWAAKRSNRATLAKLGAKRLILVHLPFPETDLYGYNEATALAVRDFLPGAVILNRFLQSVDISL